MTNSNYLNSSYNNGFFFLKLAQSRQSLLTDYFDILNISVPEKSHSTITIIIGPHIFNNIQVYIIDKIIAFQYPSNPTLFKIPDLIAIQKTNFNAPFQAQLTIKHRNEKLTVCMKNIDQALFTNLEQLVPANSFLGLLTNVTPRNQDDLSIQCEFPPSIKEPKQKLEVDTANVETKETIETPSKEINGSDAINSYRGQRQCNYCGCRSTPLWRKGPNGNYSLVLQPGKSTLCNSCGMKWKSGKILQDNFESSDTPKREGRSRRSISRRVTPSPITEMLISIPQDQMLAGEQIDQLVSFFKQEEEETDTAEIEEDDNNSEVQEKVMVPLKKRKY
ncbi:hypothetical protein ROZALSC1DRAFT_29223 [Rozella allomycis CSF55]|uniref:GATA-type domain-containing protein n=1 Tax=Rozella allomycis (strain CSF55) TaxID=988480 RepID=A0A075ASW4_ROZAC|nr:hypothetical protein O9G_000051 [Rozella allomycis CSF55]RKP19147.1 hypothetical protein ROZALSC1DRAFT_29223 [Rozella allomycis CSF55]|eukprot:EPZ31573.1 hypothetical protein O9G_000051 [Rozella allomycis CSF55]